MNRARGWGLSVAAHLCEVDAQPLALELFSVHVLHGHLRIFPVIEAHERESTPLL